MKKIIVLFLLIFLLTGCTKSEGKRVLNVLNWSSYIPSDVITNFEKETGIKVNYMTYSSNEELLAKISMAKPGTYDLIFPSDYMVEIMISRGVIEKIDKSKLRNIDNLDVSYMDMEYDPGNIYTLPFIATSTVISVNREFIDDNITSYNDLLNPKFKGEIVLIDDQRIIIGMALLANGFDMNSTDSTELRVAKKWLLKLKNNLKAYDSDSPKNFLISKEASLAVLWNAEGALANIENDKIENIFPVEGTALSTDNFAIPKGAKNISELYEFIDYILRPDVMAEIINFYPYKSINTLSYNYFSDEYKNNLAANFSSDVVRNGHFVKNIGEYISLYDKIWAEIK